jgi:N-carbamoyl-L-amino-acid hydrolase
MKKVDSLVKGELPALKINKNRIQNNIQELGEIGLSEEGGINRSLASQADAESRNWLKSLLEKSIVR